MTQFRIVSCEKYVINIFIAKCRVFDPFHYHRSDQHRGVTVKKYFSRSIQGLDMVQFRIVSIDSKETVKRGTQLSQLLDTI